MKTHIENFLSKIHILKEKSPYQKFTNWRKKTYLKKYTEKDAETKVLCLIEKLVIFSLFIALLGVIYLGILNHLNIDYFSIPAIIFLITFILISIVRICDILVYQFYVIFVAPSMGDPLRGPERMIILLIINYFEIIFWFAFFYRIIYNLFDNVFVGSSLINSINGSLYFSVVTMTTLGYGDVTPSHWFSMFLICIQVLIGLFIAFILIARFIPLLKNYLISR